jgi:hypothetical protein
LKQPSTYAKSRIVAPVQAGKRLVPYEAIICGSAVIVGWDQKNLENLTTLTESSMANATPMSFYLFPFPFPIENRERERERGNIYYAGLSRMELG